jgi:hypothetical protein
VLEDCNEFESEDQHAGAVSYTIARSVLYDEGGDPSESIESLERHLRDLQCLDKSSSSGAQKFQNISFGAGTPANTF